MRVALIGTEAGGGGAGRALARSAEALIRRGHDVDIIQLDRDRATKHSIVITRAPGDAGNPDRHADVQHLERSYLAARRSALTDTLFSHDLFGYDISQLDFLRGYDAINIHWTSFFLSVEIIGDIIRLGRPVLFTLHDMAHFTGGCHYAAGCNGYLTDCAACPQINPDVLRVAARARALKQLLYNKPNVSVTAPSAWLTTCAAASGVFAGRTCHRISNPIDIDVFRPLDRQAARAGLGLNAEDCTLLFGAFHGGERRKGFRHLAAAIEVLRQDPRAKPAIENDRLKVLTFGLGAEDVSSIDLPTLSLGFVQDDAKLAQIYNASDVLLLPSIEDNQPNVMIEAMACGTPVVGFNIGGVPDWVRDGETGYLAPAFDVNAFAERTADIVFNADLSRLVRAGATEKVRRECNMDAVGEQIETLLHSMCAAIGPPQESYTPPPCIDGVRSAAAPLRYGPRLDALAGLLPPAVHVEPDVQEEPIVELAVDSTQVSLERFQDARAQLLTALRDAPGGQLRAAYRLTRGRGADERRAVMLSVLASYPLTWSTVAGASRRLPAYGVAALRRLVRRDRASKALS